MKDEWRVNVDVFSVDLVFEVGVASGARLTESDCDCDTTECRHERIAEARVRHVFSDDDREWEDERERLGLPDDDTDIVESPAQWSALLDDGDGEEQNDSNSLVLGSIWD